MLNLTSHLPKGSAEAWSLLLWLLVLSLFTVFLATCAVTAWSRWTNIVSNCVCLCGVYGTDVPPPPTSFEVFSYSSCCTFLTSIPCTYYTESLRILTLSAFCNIASVDTCSASIYLSRPAIICQIATRDQYDQFILLLLWITESSLVLDCVCKMFGGFSFCHVHLCCAISRNTHQHFGS